MTPDTSYSDLHWHLLLQYMKGAQIGEIAMRSQIPYRVVRLALMPLLIAGRGRELISAKRKFWHARKDAKRRNIEWQFTFDSWWSLWRQSGKWADRGVCRGQYVMARHHDTGPYAADNVSICLSRDNVIFANAKLDEQSVREIRASRENQDELSYRYRISQSVISGIRSGKYWSHVI